jgi:hypothetical protein
MKKVLTLAVVFTTIVWTMGVAAFIPVASAATLAAGDLIKASGPAVYYYAADGKRYTFPTEATFKTWFSDFSGVKRITDDELAGIDLAGNVAVRPGTKLVKITTVPKVFAVEPNGMLTWVATEAAAKTLYGNDWAKKVIDVPDGFWVNYTNSGKQLDGSAYPVGQLIKYSGSTDVYRVNADGTKSLVTPAGMTANNWSSAFVVTAPASIALSNSAEISTKANAYADVSQGGGAGSAIVGIGTLSVALSSATPASNYVSNGVQNALFSKYSFASVGGSATVSKIVLQRKGLSVDGNIDSVRLFDGLTQVGTDQSFNTTTHQVTFNNVNWAVSGTKTLSVKANINSAASSTGTNAYFELVQVVDSAGNVMNLSIPGNAMMFATISAGNLDVVAQSSGSTLTVISGATNQELGCWNLVSTATEGFEVDSIKLTNIGSASSLDAKNFSLKVSSTLIPGSQVASMAGDSTLTFALSTPYKIAKSTTKKVCLYGDISSGITVSKTLRFQVAETKHFIARGDSSGGEVLITSTGASPFSAESAHTNSIAQGTATLAQDAAYAPTAGTVIVKGVPGNKMAAYKLTAGPNEGVKLTKLTVVLSGANTVATDFSGWSLYKIVDGAEVLIPVNGSVSGLNISFEDTTNGLLDVPKSEGRTLIVKGDVSTSAAGNEVPAIYVGANGTTNTLARIKGLDSGEYITSGVTLSGVRTDDQQAMDIEANGTLVVSKAATSPAAATVSPGVTKKHLTTVNLYATGEAVNVTDLVLTGTSNLGVATSAALINVYLTDEAGVTVGSPVATPDGSGQYSFSFSYVVPRDTNKTLKVYGDIPGSAVITSIRIDMDTANTDITSTGLYSQATLTESGTCTGSTFTVAAPTLLASMSSAPVANSYVINSTNVTIGTLQLTAGASQDVKVTSILVTADDANSLDGASTASARFSNIKLVDANNSAIQYGITKNLTDGDAGVDTVSFTGISNLIVTGGQTKNVLIVADIVGSATTFYFGVADPQDQITATGMSSNTTATVSPNNTAIASAGATLTTVALFKITKAADMAPAAQLVSGSTGNSLMKYRLDASYEDVTVTQLPIFFEGVTSNVANFKLYQDGVLLGDPNGYSFSGGTGVEKIVYFSAGTFVIKKDVPTYLTIKMDLNPKSQVTTLASTPQSTNYQIGISDSAGNNGSEWDGAGGAGSYTIVANGVSSGTTITAGNQNSTGAGGGLVYGSNPFTFHKGILIVNKAAASPSGVQTAGGNSEVLRFDLAAIGDDISINGLEFCLSGTATNAANTPTGMLYLRDVAGNENYGDISMVLTEDYDAYWSVDGLSGAGDYYFTADGLAETRCASFGDGTSVLVGNVINRAMEAFTIVPTITAGTTKSFKITMDTTGIATNESLQVTIGPNPAATCGAGNNAACAVTTSGIEYEDSSGVDVDLATTKNLPVTGGTLLY